MRSNKVKKKKEPQPQLQFSSSGNISAEKHTLMWIIHCTLHKGRFALVTFEVLRMPPGVHGEYSLSRLQGFVTLFALYLIREGERRGALAGI
jgi:hypothetical protein